MERQVSGDPRGSSVPFGLLLVAVALGTLLWMLGGEPPPSQTGADGGERSGVGGESAAAGTDADRAARRTRVLVEAEAEPEAAPRDVPAPQDGYGVLVLTAVHAETGERLPHELLSHVSGSHRQRSRTFETDADGVAVLERLEPGVHQISRGAWSLNEVLVVAGEVGELELRLPEAPRLVGRIVWPDGSPAAGVGFEWFDDGLGAKGTGVADAGGGFEIRGRTNVTVYASTETHLGQGRASLMVPAEVRSLEVTLAPRSEAALPERAGSIRLRVLDPAGEPVEGARVRVERRPGAAETEPLHPGRPRSAATDAAGLAALDGVGVGLVEVGVWHREHRPARVAVSVQEHPTEEAPDPVTVSLPPAAVLQGEVRGPDGRPVTDARMRWTPEEKEFGPWSFGSRYDTDTDARGRYRFGLVDPGEVTVEVVSATAGYAAWTGSVALAGTRKDFVLSAAASLRGRVFDHMGAPVRGWMVDGHHARTRTAEDGSFVLAFRGEDLARHPEAGLTIRIRGPWSGRLGRDGEHTFEGVRPGVRDFHLPPPRQDLGRLGGRLVLEDSGEPVQGAFLIAHADRGSATVLVDPRDGSFESEGLPAGPDWKLLVQSGRSGTVAREFGPFEVVAGTTTALGTLRLPAGHPFALDLDAGGRGQGPVYGRIVGTGGLEQFMAGLRPTPSVRGEAGPRLEATGRLPAGSYRVTVWGPGVARTTTTVRVGPGAAVPTLELRPGVVVRIVCDPVPARADRKRIVVRRRGQVVFEDALDGVAWTEPWQWHLAPGTGYEVEVVAGGRTGSLAFDVPAGGMTEPEALVVPLR